MEKATAKDKFFNFFNRYGYIFYIAGAVFLIVTLCSKCSFLYPFNDWVDSNCFFTVAKAMANGQVLYKDIYEQKGLYLYVLHIPAYRISHTTFIGVYLYELVSAGLFAYAAYLLIKLYADKVRAVMLTPYMIVAAFASISFCHGDSAEEFIMPLMAFSLFFMLKYAKGGGLKLYKYALSGAFAGLAFWVKFTLCGFFIGWIILAFVFEIIRKDIRHAFAGAAVFLGAMAAVSVPALVYFGVCGALGDMYECYVYNNMFLYTGEKSSVFQKLGLMLRGYGLSIVYGLLFYISIIPGFVYIAASKNFTRFEKAALFTLYAVTNFFIFVGGRRSKYYGLPSCIFSFAGAVALCGFNRTRRAVDYLTAFILPADPVAPPPADGKTAGIAVKRAAAACAVSLILVAGFSMALCVNTPFMFRKKSDLPQFKLAAIIKEENPNATLLNYGTLDSGLYTVADIVPTCRYFCGLNIPLQELTDTQNEWIADGKTDYVLSAAPIENIDLKYELVSQASYRYEWKMRTYYLYGLKK